MEDITVWVRWEGSPNHPATEEIVESFDVYAGDSPNDLIRDVARRWRRLVAGRRDQIVICDPEGTVSIRDEEYWSQQFDQMALHCWVTDEPEVASQAQNPYGAPRPRAIESLAYMGGGESTTQNPTPSPQRITEGTFSGPILVMVTYEGTMEERTRRQARRAPKITKPFALVLKNGPVDTVRAVVWDFAIADGERILICDYNCRDMSKEKNWVTIQDFQNL